LSGKSVADWAVLYVQAGFVLVPFAVGQKGPTWKGWNQPDMGIRTIEDAEIVSGNLGLLHAYCGVVCLDIDDKAKAIAWFAEQNIDLQALLNADDAVLIHRGHPNKTKILFRCDAKLPTRMFAKFGFELRCASAKGRSMQDVLPPSMHPSGSCYRWGGKGHWSRIPTIPAPVLALWLRLTAVAEQGEKQPLGVGREDLEDLLERIDPSELDYDAWLHVGMALHFETGGGPDGLTLWDQWSSRSPKFDPDYGGPKYASFSLDYPNPRTIATLQRMADADMSSEFQPISDFEPTAAPVLGDDTFKILGIDGRITADEWEAPPRDPDIVVDRLLLMDACGFVAPGGTGKTTVSMVEYINIILGRPVWDRRVVRPGGVAFLTAEDTRSVTISRLKRAMDATGLSGADRKRVQDNFFIDDVSLKGVRLVKADKHGELRATRLKTELIKKYSGRGLAVLHLDPASLLGPGEVHANDGGAVMNLVLRQLSIELQCCTQLIAHVAQAVARGGIMDQYAARGGTANVDNSRGQRQMVRLKSRDLDFNGTKYRIPEEAVSDEDIRLGRVLAILVHKLSYVELDPTPIFIGRQGFRFTHLQPQVLGKPREATVDDDLETIAGFIERGLANGQRFTASALSDLHHKAVGLPRTRIRDLIKEGQEIGRFALAELPPDQRQGSRTSYLITTEVGHEGL
jgi:hypothetical protein